MYEQEIERSGVVLLFVEDQARTVSVMTRREFGAPRSGAGRPALGAPLQAGAESHCTS